MTQARRKWDDITGSTGLKRPFPEKHFLLILADLFGFGFVRGEGTRGFNYLRDHTVYSSELLRSPVLAFA